MSISETINKTGSRNIATGIVVKKAQVRTTTAVSLKFIEEKKEIGPTNKVENIITQHADPKTYTKYEIRM